MTLENVLFQLFNILFKQKLPTLTSRWHDNYLLTFRDIFYPADLRISLCSANPGKPFLSKPEAFYPSFPKLSDNWLANLAHSPLKVSLSLPSPTMGRADGCWMLPGSVVFLLNRVNPNRVKTVCEKVAASELKNCDSAWKSKVSLRKKRNVTKSGFFSWG